MIEKITKGVKISVKTKFNGATYRDHKLHYVFAYFITIKNNSQETIQLTHRFWKIYDALNKTEVVSGEGVVGQSPVLLPNDEYSYSSGCLLQSGIGAMNGYYTMCNTTSLAQFKVYVPTFQLATTLLSN
ncbi:Co2+/Mg2+ efflux protein ApaG [Polaribacter sp.]|uniref:Co2+/Mg2+ efflux protein ApaG n=1 Tax=Polaribacter sp. TaxID=1920175 RepID=UPI003F699483